MPGGWSSERLADKFAERTGERLLIDCGELSTDLFLGTVKYRDVDLSQLDALVIKKVGSTYSPDMLDRLEVLKYLADGGLPVYSQPGRIMRLLDRLSCTLTLARGGIPMPRTFATENVQEAKRIIELWGPVVFKPLFSTKARGMTVLDPSMPDLLDRLIQLQSIHPQLYLQEKLDLPDRDLSLVFIGGRYVGTYARVRGEGAWNTTTQAGGHYEAHESSPELVRLAQKAQALFGLDLTSVDIAEVKGGPLVFEVSAFGGYRGLYESQGLDAGDIYSDFVLERLRGS